MSNEDKSNDADLHSCCHNSGDRIDDDGMEEKSFKSSRVGSYLGGIGAAIAACICCCLPIVAIALGVATMNQFDWFHRYHQIFEIVGWLFMFAAVLLMWYQHRREDVHILRDKHFWIPLVCMFVVYFAMTSILHNWVTTQSGNGSNLHNHH
ncbi:MAG: hypothetical protein K8F91_02505 [Candidatus Obscuribacterales bacterium]|nr:hypothetical protein [Candidatus Obscuribacterales bacterium]